MTRVMLVCSAGGHLAEMLRILPAFDGCRLSLVTYRSSRGARPIEGIPTYLLENIGTSPFRLLRALPMFVRALWLERPNVIVSTGSEIAIPFFYLARVLRIKTLTTDLPPLREVSPPGTAFVRPGSASQLERELQRIAIAGRSSVSARPTRRWESVIDDFEAVLERPQAHGDRAIVLNQPRPRTVYLCGIDGIGKTTQARLLVETLKTRGIPARYVWLRFPQFVSLPVLALSRALGVTRYETIAGRRMGGWEFHRARWLAWLLLWTQVVDAWLFRLLRVDLPKRRGMMVILDRFALDIVVDIAAAARDPSLLDTLQVRLLIRLLPDGITVMLDAEPARIRRRRGDLTLDASLEQRSLLYRRLAELVPTVRVLDGLESAESIHATVLELARVGES